MSRDWYQDLRDFHRAVDKSLPEYPQLPDEASKRLRKSLIQEEVKETLDALDEGDLEGIADGIADSIVVLIGTAVAYGIDIRPIWDEVHRTNMTKVKGPRREDGKILKPEGWIPPDIQGILKAQGGQI